MLQILLIVFGLIALSKGSLKITNSRYVKDTTGRILGVILLLGAFTMPFIALIVVIAVGLMTSEKIVQDEPEKVKAKNKPL